jgi:WD40 repeat protein
LTSDIESITWDPFNQFHMYCALEDGTILCVDVRKCGAAGSAFNNAAVQFSFQAHEQTTSALSFSCKIPGMLATASIDKTVKIWDVSPPTSTTRGAVASSASAAAVIISPREVAYKTMSAGKLFTMQFSPDDPYLLAAAGDTGVLAVWESDELHTIEMYFKDRVVVKDSLYSSLTGVGRNSNGSSSNSKDEDINAADKAIATTGDLPSSDAFNDVAMIIADRPDDSWMNDNNDVNSHKDAKKKSKKKKASKNI